MATQPSQQSQPASPFINTLGMQYMPINLKSVLTKYGIRQTEWCSKIIQSGGSGTGRGISQASASLLLNYNQFPKATPAEEVKAQTEDFLRARGVADSEIATLWDFDAEDKGRAGRRNAPRKPKSHNEVSVDEFIEDQLPENAMLSAHAKKHFKLFLSPFEDDVKKPEDVFLSSEQRYIRESMFNAAKNGGFLAVIGESGSGKTTLRRDLIDRIQREGHEITIVQPRIFDKSRLTAGSICEAIIQDIAPNTTVGGSLEGKARKIERLLTESSRGGYSHVLMIEEAHDLHIKTLKYLKRFWEMEDGFRKLLAVILIGQPELNGKLDERQNFEAREVIRRCEIAMLEPLNGDMEDYLKLKFKRVGKELSDVFDDDAFAAIRERLTLQRRGAQNTISMHYPLIVNNTVTKCLNLAAEMGAKKINAEIIQGI